MLLRQISILVLIYVSSMRVLSAQELETNNQRMKILKRYTEGTGPQKSGTHDPQKDLVLTIRAVPDDEVEDAVKSRGPWVSVKLRNNAKQNWYFSRDAIQYGLKISVTDSSGRALQATAKAAERSQNALTSTPRRSVELSFGEEEAFELALGDFFSIPKDKPLRVSLEWTINMHPFKAARDAAFSSDPPKGLSPKFTSNVLELPNSNPRSK